MYYEEKLIDGVWYWRGTPTGDWIVKTVQMSKAQEDEKWKSKNGHAISSDVTDSDPNAFKKNCDLIIENTKLKFQLAEAVRVIEKAKRALSVGAYNGNRTDLEAFTYCRDFLAKLGR